MADLAHISAKLSTALPGAVRESAVKYGELTISVEAARILDVLSFLRDDADCEFKILVDICGNDWPQRQKRFDVVYHLLSLTKNARIRVKAQVGAGESIPSLLSLYPAAGWFE